MESRYFKTFIETQIFAISVKWTLLKYSEMGYVHFVCVCKCYGTKMWTRPTSTIHMNCIYICRHCDNTFECINKTIWLASVFWHSFISLFCMCLLFAQSQFQMELISFSFSLVPIAMVSFLWDIVFQSFFMKNQGKWTTFIEICRASDITACSTCTLIPLVLLQLTRLNLTQLYLLFLLSMIHRSCVM